MCVCMRVCCVGCWGRGGYWEEEEEERGGGREREIKREREIERGGGRKREERDGWALGATEGTASD